MKHLVAATILAGALALPAAALAADYTIMAPAAPGGGWDSTSRAANDPRRWERELFGRVPYVQPGS